MSIKKSKVLSCNSNPNQPESNRFFSNIPSFIFINKQPLRDDTCKETEACNLLSDG